MEGFVKYKGLLGSVLFALCTSVSASGYVGIGYGETDYDADEISTFDDPNGLEFYFGYKTSENLGFEFGLVNFGEADDGIPPEWHLEADSLAFSLLGLAPVGAKSEVFFQFGFHMWDAEISEDGFGVFAEDDGNDVFYGVGFRANVTDKLGLGLRYNNYDFDGDDVTRLSLNAQIGFD
jgi:opacity protein-like surface antigen